MTKRKLPIGIQTFRTIREEGWYYVDKTAYAQRLADEGTHYFLSRPRRFGKSLFLDTLKELFEGNEPLFEGLAVHERRDWSIRHPVLRLSFGSGQYNRPGFLEAHLTDKLAAVERAARVSVESATAVGRFAALIEALHEQAGQRVAVLIDEYDKPILDALDVPEVARANRDYLRGLYSVIEDCDAHVKFTFLAGVSKFSRVSIFSGLNNLKDITLDPRCSAICGYTDADLDTVFAPELPGLDRNENGLAATRRSGSVCRRAAARIEHTGGGDVPVRPAPFAAEGADQDARNGAPASRIVLMPAPPPGKNVSKRDLTRNGAPASRIVLMPAPPP